jgi:hypothetical protein
MSQVFTGSKASLKLNGQKVAFVGSINITQELTLTDIDVLDQLEIGEAAETGFKCNFTANLFKIDTNSAASLGLETSNISDFLSQGEMTMEVYDSIGDKVQFTMKRVKWEGGSGSVDARGVYQGVFNFKGVTSTGL